ncbi:MAG: YbaB/EbfC family nucleoid-associated protein [Kiritimatiellia bacterium]|jgi:DNA-binding protein YbaB
MANMFDQVKQAMQMRKEAKRMQAEVEKITAEYSNGGITCVVRGDLTVTSITFAPGAFDEVLAGKPDRFNTMLVNVVNNALKSAKNKTQEQMVAAMKANGLGDMLGGLGGLG